jgi:hypothetical protein
MCLKSPLDSDFICRRHTRALAFMHRKHARALALTGNMRRALTFKHARATC